MKRDRDLYRDFEQLACQEGPHSRGLRLEPLVAEMFEQAGYEVRRASKTAAPRRTDLVAIKGRDLYLVEVKWQKDPADVDVVDSLRSRLSRADLTTRGILVSVSGVTSGAVGVIEHERDRPIAVITGDELGAFMYAPGRLPHGLARKYRELFFNAKVLLGERALDWPESSPGELAPSEVTIVGLDGSRSAMDETAGRFASCLFSLKLADVDWVPTAGAAVAADVSLRFRSAGRLADLLKGLAALGWASSPSWAIKQQSNCWIGFGAREFVEALDDHKARYEGLEEVHHTEQALYYDTFDGGSYTVALDISADESRVITYCNLSLQLEGMPFDNEPLNQLLEFCEAERNVYARSMTSPAVEKPFVAPLNHVGGIVKTCGLSVGGQQHLPAGGQLKLPGHGRLVTQRADAE